LFFIDNNTYRSGTIYGGIPFELKTKQPNMITIQAIQELEEGKGHKTNSTSALFNDLQVKLLNA
jgi:DNA-damage-inducible protein J